MTRAGRCGGGRRCWARLVRPDASIAAPDWVCRATASTFFEAAREHQLEGIVAKESGEPRTCRVSAAAPWLTDSRAPARTSSSIGGYHVWRPLEPAMRGETPAQEPLSSLLAGAMRVTTAAWRYVGEVVRAASSPDEMDGAGSGASTRATATDVPRSRTEPAPGQVWCSGVKPEVGSVLITLRGPRRRTAGCASPVFEALRHRRPGRTAAASPEAEA